MSREFLPHALILDDDPFFIQIAERVLAGLGFSSDSFDNAADFMKRLGKVKVGFCLIDLRVGNSPLEGFRIVEEIRAKHGQGITIFIASASADGKLIAHALEIGANDYLVKPIDAAILASKLTPFFSSTAIDSLRSPWVHAPRDHAAVSVLADFELQAVDENGLTLRSRHLLAKGSAVQIRSPLSTSLFGEGQYPILKVRDTWVEADKETFGAYAEIHPDDEHIFVAVRRWLVKMETGEKK